MICALGQHSLVDVLTRCGLPLPRYILADEKHSRCLTDRVYLPTIVSGRVFWHLGYSNSKSAAAFTASYGQFQQAALTHEPSYQVRGALTDGFDSTVSSMRTLFPGARLAHHLLVWGKQWLSRVPATRRRLQGYGLVRLLRDVWAVPGVIRWRRGWMVSVRFNPLHPLTTPLQESFSALFRGRVRVGCLR